MLTSTALRIRHGKRYRYATSGEILDAAAAILINENRGAPLRSRAAVTSTAPLRRPRQHFGAVWLDTRHGVLHAEVLFTGTIDGAVIYPRVVAKRALELNASAVIFAHNHPSGVAEPSEADRSITAKLAQALSLIDVRVLDHLVVVRVACDLASAVGCDDPLEQQRACREPAPDFTVQNHGVVLLRRTRSAKRWCDEHLASDAMTWGRAFVVEPRYVADIVRGIVDDGLSVRL
jgi:DNA repair protein RadC